MVLDVQSTRRISAFAAFVVVNAMGFSAPLALSAPIAVSIATGSKNASYRVPSGAVARIVQFAVGLSVYASTGEPMQGMRMPGIW